MTRMRFNESKATEAAALILKLRGGQMSYMKLIKLLYIVDREALWRWGRPVTTDRYVSMDRGPVLSHILDLINEGHAPNEPGIWDSYISSPSNYEVRLLADPPEEELSVAEGELIKEVFKKYGHLNRWDLVNIAHRFPEWHDPHGSAYPISEFEILKAGNKSDEEAREIVLDLESLAMAEEVLTPA
jgi:uncharacterized phage-associated protein